MKSMLKQALLVASMFVVPAMVAADAKPAVATVAPEVTATATTSTPWYSTAWSKTKSGANTALESTRSAGRKAANFVADYTVRTSAAKKIGSLFLAKDGSVSKVKVGAAVAGYAAAAIGSYQYLSNGQYGKTAKWVTSPFWAPVHGAVKLYTWAFPTAIAKAEKVVAKAQKAVEKAEKNKNPQEVAAAQKALLEAKVAVAQVRLEAVQAERNALVDLQKLGKATREQVDAADKAVVKAQAELNAAKAALQPAPAAAPAQQPAPAAVAAPVAAAPAAQPAPAVAPAQPVFIERTVVVEQPKQAVAMTPVKATPVVTETVEAVDAEINAILSQPNGASKMDTMYWKTRRNNARKAAAAAGK